MNNQMPEEIQNALAKEVAAFIIITGLPQQFVLEYTQKIVKIISDYIVGEFNAESPEDIVKRVVAQYLATNMNNE